MEYTGPCPEHLIERAEEPVASRSRVRPKGLANHRRVGLDSLRREAPQRRNP
jgi:hypothetical protein